MEMNGQIHFDRCIPWERTPDTYELEAVWNKEKLWVFWKRKTLLSLPGTKLQIIQPVAKSLYSLKYLLISGP
jgi:hypothetical protein